MDRIDAAQQRQFTLPEGTWTLRRLGILDGGKVAGQATMFLGCPFDDAPLASREVAWMWATITVATVQAPPTWDWNAYADTQVLETLFNQFVEWDNSFRTPMAEPAADMGAGAGT